MDDQVTARGSPEAEPERPGYWAVLPASVRYDTQLPDKAKLLYAEISSLTEARGYCFASNAYFMRLYDMTDRTLQRHLKALAAAGYIRILDGDGGKARRKIYAGVNPLANPDKIVGVPANPDKNVGVTPTKLSGGNKNRKEEQRSPQTPQGGCASVPSWKPERFDGLWTYYPRHTSKQAAAKAWDKLRPSDELIAEIGRALRRQRAWDEWQRGIGIPNLSTYLNQRRWEDELTDIHAAAAPREEEAEIWL